MRGEGRRRVSPRSVLTLGIALVAIAGAAALVAVPSLRLSLTDGITGGIDQIRRIVMPSLEIERPAAVEAADDVPGHPAELMFDTFTNTDWRTAAANPEVTVRFEEPVDLGAIIVHSGAADGFVELRRPATLVLEFPDGSSTTIRLEDVHDPQQFDLGASGVDRVVIRVGETNGPAGTDLSISEIELFARR